MIRTIFNVGVFGVYVSSLCFALDRLINSFILRNNKFSKKWTNLCFIAFQVSNSKIMIIMINSSQAASVNHLLFDCCSSDTIRQPFERWQKRPINCRTLRCFYADAYTNSIQLLYFSWNSDFHACNLLYSHLSQQLQCNGMCFDGYLNLKIPYSPSAIHT